MMFLPETTGTTDANQQPKRSYITYNHSPGISSTHATQHAAVVTKGAWHMGALVVAAYQWRNSGIYVESRHGGETGSVLLPGRGQCLPHLPASGKSAGILPA